MRHAHDSFFLASITGVKPLQGKVVAIDDGGYRAKFVGLAGDMIDALAQVCNDLTILGDRTLVVQDTGAQAVHHDLDGLLPGVVVAEELNDLERFALEPTVVLLLQEPAVENPLRLAGRLSLVLLVCQCVLDRHIPGPREFVEPLVNRPRLVRFRRLTLFPAFLAEPDRGCHAQAGDD